MTELLQRFYLLALILLFYVTGCLNDKALSLRQDEKYAEQNALGMIRTSCKSVCEKWL